MISVFVGVGRFDLFLLEQPQSLKAKRSVVRRLRDKIRHRLHLSVAEVDAQDLWQRAVFGVTCVSSDPLTAARLLQDCAKLIASDGAVEIVGEETDVTRW